MLSDGLDDLDADGFVEVVPGSVEVPALGGRVQKDGARQALGVLCRAALADGAVAGGDGLMASSSSARRVSEWRGVSDADAVKPPATSNTKGRAMAETVSVRVANDDYEAEVVATGGKYVVRWNDLVANEWSETFDTLSAALLGFGVVVQAIDEGEGADSSLVPDLQRMVRSSYRRASLDDL